MTLSRSFLTILVPGLIAVAPWILALVQYTPATLGYGEFTTLGNALVFVSAVVAGAICEGLGSHLELRWDRARESKYEVEKHWYAYLSRPFEHEPVGYRYLSRMVTTMYFELSMLFAVPPFVVGAGTLATLRFPSLACFSVPATLIVGALAIWYFHWQAKCTHEVLCKTRKKLIELLPPAA